MTSAKNGYFEDIKSGLIVSLVALPLCLGIALASGAPLLSGLIAGIIGGIVVGIISNSQVSVSGPAAGLAVIVLGAIQDLNSFNLFLVSVMFAGALQICLGVFRMGGLAKYIDHAVIEGMLASIGILIILKQIPYALGILNFKSYFEQFGNMDFSNINSGALLIGLICLSLFIIHNTTQIKHFKIFKFVPFSIFMVILAAVLAAIMAAGPWALDIKQFVNMGGLGQGSNLLDVLQKPDFSQWMQFKTIKYGFIIAAVASIETLLCIEAGDKLDRHHRKTSTNRELIAQGAGNMLSGLLGGLPITSVIVRTSVNIQSGAQTKLSAIFHGLLLLSAILLFPGLVTLIPLTVLACILLNAGYNLAHPQKLYQMFKNNFRQSVPFFTTIVLIVSTDLLMGVICGQILSFAMAKIFPRDVKGAHVTH